MRADLHVHTYYSADGSGPPGKIFETARAAGADVIALAEHNSCAHIEECLVLAAKPRMPSYVPAMEVSCTTSRTGNQEVHLLCYFVDSTARGWQSPGIHALTSRLAGIQRENLHRIVHALGVTSVQVDEIVAWCREQGHIHPSVPPSMYFLRRYYSVRGDREAAAALSAARRSLNGSGALESYPAIDGLGDLIRRADCRWFLAHPDRYQWSENLLESIVGELAELGLAGIEANYLASMQAEPRLAAIAERHGLSRSVGTDLHGLHDVPPARYAQMLDSVAPPEGTLDWLWPGRGRI
jgi:predicted metal-dependent phosphoesterase TrpH